MKARIFVLLGAPGAGKGTQADILSSRFDLPHIATGDLFRAEVGAGTELGLAAKAFMDRGELVPDEVTIKMLLDRLGRPDAACGVILDGFPRNCAQAEVLDRALAESNLEVELALYIDVPAEDLLARLAGRWVCRNGHTYHEKANPPRNAGLCDVDGLELFQRDDDRTEIVRARLEKQLAPLGEVVEYYASRSVLRSVDGRLPIDDVTRELLAAIEIVGEARNCP